jgi:hypothetical protein
MDLAKGCLEILYFLNKLFKNILKKNISNFSIPKELKKLKKLI